MFHLREEAIIEFPNILALVVKNTHHLPLLAEKAQTQQRSRLIDYLIIPLLRQEAE